MKKSNDWKPHTNQNLLKKQRSISPRKVKGLQNNQRDLYKSIETLSSIQIRHQRKDNQLYVKTLQRITRQLDEIKQSTKTSPNVSIIKRRWVHKPFT